MLVFPYFAEPAFVGRPLFVTMAVTLAVLSLWTRPQEESLSELLYYGPDRVRGLDSWQLVSFHFDSRRVPPCPAISRKALRLTLCWLLGSILGAIPTGHPVEFLRQAALIPMLALGTRTCASPVAGWGVSTIRRQLSGPLCRRGHLGTPQYVVAPKVWRDPVFWMAAVGLLLGLRVLRFWLDLGPARPGALGRRTSRGLAGGASDGRWGAPDLSGDRGKRPANRRGRPRHGRRGDGASRDVSRRLWMLLDRRRGLGCRNRAGFCMPLISRYSIKRFFGTRQEIGATR